MKKISSQAVFCAVLVLIVVGSALTLVSVRQLNRLAFYDLQKLERERDGLSIEWRQLMAEFSTWRLEHNIENEVRGEHKMEPPGSSQIQIIHLAAGKSKNATGGTLR
ncbi:MAG: cell division protein FtsL [Proteobacteria bacterium]|nr:cell division protein FtsL [Pseudomonadota bacterium]